MITQKTLFHLGLGLLLAVAWAPAQPITSIAGTGVATFGGDGGVATGASLNHPRGMAFDGAGNMYVADLDNSRVRKIAGDGTITTFAGNGTAGYSGDGGAA